MCEKFWTLPAALPATAEIAHALRRRGARRLPARGGGLGGPKVNDASSLPAPWCRRPGGGSVNAGAVHSSSSWFKSRPGLQNPNSAGIREKKEKRIARRWSLRQSLPRLIAKKCQTSATRKRTTADRPAPITKKILSSSARFEARANDDSRGSDHQSPPSAHL